MTNLNPSLLNKFIAPATNNSFFFSFEGIEGAGKSTHITRLKSDLEKLGFNVILTREPGGTVFGEKLREAILKSSVPLDPIAEAHLFASSRAQLLKEVTLKNLEKEKTIVIYDRYLDSSLAYQGMARGLGAETVLQIHQHFPLTIVPHRTFYLRIGLETSLQRQAMRNNDKDYFEAENQSFYRKLIEGYDLAMSLFPLRFCLIDAEQSIDHVYRDIYKAACEILGVKA